MHFGAVSVLVERLDRGESLNVVKEGRLRAYSEVFVYVCVMSCVYVLQRSSKA